MVLTKKYRLVWNAENEMISDPFEENIGSETIIGFGCGGFETESLTEMHQKIRQVLI